MVHVIKLLPSGVQGESSHREMAGLNTVCSRLSLSARGLQEASNSAAPHLSLLNACLSLNTCKICLWQTAPSEPCFNCSAGGCRSSAHMALTSSAHFQERGIRVDLSHGFLTLPESSLKLQGWPELGKGAPIPAVWTAPLGLRCSNLRSGMVHTSARLGCKHHWSAVKIINIDSIMRCCTLAFNYYCSIFSAGRQDRNRPINGRQVIRNILNVYIISHLETMDLFEIKYNWMTLCLPIIS